MKSESAEPTPVIDVQCNCGEVLPVPKHLTGKRVRCPACGQGVVAIAMAAGPPAIVPPEPVSPAMELPLAVLPASNGPTAQVESLNRRTMTTLFVGGGVFFLAGILFLVWYEYSTHQAKISAANDRIIRATESANAWLSSPMAADGNTVEQQLADSLKNPLATNARSGEAILSQVRQQRAQLAEQSRVMQSQRNAATMLADAKQNIQANRIPEAMSLLRNYISNPHATNKSEAQALLAEAETATSDTQAVASLSSMPEPAFILAKSTYEIPDGKVSNPALLARRRETVQRNLPKAAAVREEVRIAVEKQRELQERAAAERREREELARKRQQAESPSAGRSPRPPEQEFKPEKLLAMCRARIDLNASIKQVKELPEQFRGMWWMFAKVDSNNRVQITAPEIRRFTAFQFTGRSWQIANPGVENEPQKFLMIGRSGDIDGLPTFLFVMANDMFWVVHGPVDGRWILVRAITPEGDERGRSVFELKQ